METLSSIQGLRRRLAPWRRRGERIVLVPTMGGLHGGHLRLVEIAQEAGERVVVTIFVNPLQFGPHEDFGTYPRIIDDDIANLAACHVDVVFTPAAGDVYLRPAEQVTRVVVPQLSDILCGASRAGHFTGVTTVVSILFNLVQPDAAVFGEKDYQQLLIIRRMAADLHLPVTILAVPTVRAPDGLALSSRNKNLSSSERPVAAALYDSLCRAREAIAAGSDEYGAIEVTTRERLRREGFGVDYVSVRRAEDLGEPVRGDRELVILAAAQLGKVRLIDNVRVSLPKRG